MNNRIQEIDQEIKKIKNYYLHKQEEVIAKRNEMKERINMLHKSIGIMKQQIQDIQHDMHTLGEEISTLQHDSKVATHPLRAEKHAYMEKLRYEILAFEHQQQNS